jgi:hypothetical protein
MGTLDNYRSSLDYREILRILQKASTAQENFLWQSHALGRNVIGIHHCEIDFVAREVVVYFSSKRLTLDSELPLYLKLDYRSTVFKITQFRQTQSSVHFPFPEEIKTLELRSNPRQQFPPDKEKVISLRPHAGNELHVRALDISQNGLGLIVSEFNRSFFKNNRTLLVTKLGEHCLTQPIHGEVVYIKNEAESRYQIRKQKELKVGLKLSEIFPSNIYQLFIQ